MFPRFPRADDPPPPPPPPPPRSFRSYVVDSSFLSRAAFRGVVVVVRWRFSPRCEIGCRSEKNACDWYEKRLFDSFCQKKTRRKRADILRLTVFSKPNNARRTTKNHHRRRERTTFRTTNAHHRRADSFDPSLDAGRHRPERRPSSSSRAFFW